VNYYRLITGFARKRPRGGVYPFITVIERKLNMTYIENMPYHINVVL